MLNRHAIRAIFEACNKDIKRMKLRVSEMLNSESGARGHADVTDFSFREIAEGLGMDLAGGIHEAVAASQFSTIVGTLLSKQVIDAYKAVATIGDQLVTPFTSNQETEKIAGAYLTAVLEDVNEGASYPHTAGISEKYATIGHQKRGLILDITDEAIRFDQTGKVMLEAKRIGEALAWDREVRIVRAIQDLAGYKAYYPSGTQSDLYQDAGAAPHTKDNLCGSNALADYSDIDNALQLLDAMTDDNGDPIAINASIILVPRALYTVARRIIGSSILIGGSTNEGNIYKNAFTVLTSPLMNDTTSWYIGDFKAQFLEKVVIPLEVKQRGMNDNNEDAWQRDIVSSFKVRYDSKVGASDYKYVVKNTSS